MGIERKQSTVHVLDANTKGREFIYCSDRLVIIVSERELGMYSQTGGKGKDKINKWEAA